MGRKSREDDDDVMMVMMLLDVLCFHRYVTTIGLHGRYKNHHENTSNHHTWGGGKQQHHPTHTNGNHVRPTPGV